MTDTQPDSAPRFLKLEGVAEELATSRAQVHAQGSGLGLRALRRLLEAQAAPRPLPIFDRAPVPV